VVEQLEERRLLAIATLTLFFDGRQETPPEPSAATGKGTITLDTATGLFSIDVTIQGIDAANVTKFHFHRAPFGQAGPVTLDLLPKSGTFAASGVGTIRFFAQNVQFPKADIPALLAGNVYMNVHTKAFPGGEIRGQIFEPHVVALGADAGSAPRVIVYDATTGKALLGFNAYARRFQGGVRVALADFNQDGVPDILTGPGPGRGGNSDIRIFDGRTGALLREFIAYNPPFKGGVFVAAGDVSNDGVPDIVVGPDARGNLPVEEFSGKDGTLLHSFFPYGTTYRGGVRVAVADGNGDSVPDIITAPGRVAGLPVAVFSGKDFKQIDSLFPYGVAFAGGVFVAANFVNNDKFADITTAPGKLGNKLPVAVFSGADNTLLQRAFAVHQSVSGGVHVASVDVNGNNEADILTETALAGKGKVRAFDGLNGLRVDLFFARLGVFPNEVFVAGR
jgi:hypothetical protein